MIWVCVIVEDRGSYVEGQKSRVENSKFVSILKVLQLSGNGIDMPGGLYRR
jgi:hypothetical protein